MSVSPSWLECLKIHVSHYSLTDLSIMKGMLISATIIIDLFFLFADLSASSCILKSVILCLHT